MRDTLYIYILQKSNTESDEKTKTRGIYFHSRCTVLRKASSVDKSISRNCLSRFPRVKVTSVHFSSYTTLDCVHVCIFTGFQEKSRRRVLDLWFMIIRQSPRCMHITFHSDTRVTLRFFLAVGRTVAINYFARKLRQRTESSIVGSNPKFG